MEKSFKTAEKFSINLKQLPPLDPNKVSNTSSKIKPISREGRYTNEDGERDKASDCDITKVTEPHNLNIGDASTFGSRRKTTKKDGALLTTDSNNESNGKRQGKAKSNLLETCAANRWKPPLFECSTEEGPSHMKMFTFKVTVEIREASSSTVLECFSAPQPRKKSAVDHAAEGALWCLRHLGYSSKNSK